MRRLEMTRLDEQVNFNDGTFSVYDSKTMPYKEHQHMAHFALTDALIAHAGESKQPLLHFWQTSPLAILGMMDTKIAYFKKGLDVITQYNHDVIIRNSGGLAVVSDPGVLNASLIYPTGEERMSIDQGYQFMLDFIQTTFSDFPQTIEAYEITNSYCFGDYDLSINGQKIAGISQRRIKDGVAIMIYISVNGDQNQRARMLRKFYKRGTDGSEPAGRYPDIIPEVMTTLEEAYQTTFSIQDVKERMLQHFKWQDGEYTETIDAYFEEGLEKMTRRNVRVFGEDFITD